jgi:tripartite-type tricarboxylate transporter receptor subunit TctC
MVMRLVRRTFLSLAVAAAAAPVVSRIAMAKPYPTRPVRLIVPYAPAGPTDIAARLIAQGLSDRLGEQFYVENVAGAGGNIGTSRAAKAAPDGYTLVFVGSNHVINPALYDKIPYNPQRDFDPVTLAVTTPMVLSINASLPARTIKELIALIRSNPGKYNYASGGVGTPGHLVGEQFRLSLGLDLLHIPYNSAGLAISSTVAGHTPICIVAPAPTVPQVQDGKLRALAVTGRTRSTVLPNVPTMAEAGYPGIEGENWFGMLVPVGTPNEVITKLNRVIVEVIASPAMKERLGSLGFETVGSTPTEFAERIAVELDKWGKLIRAANIKVE